MTIKLIKQLATSSALAASLVVGTTVSTAFATESAPAFPSCTTLTPPGDWSHTTGLNHIPGQEAPINSQSDDVYYLSNGNFVQCLCPIDGETGIQTNWWNVNDVSTSVINEYRQNGWFAENGSNWNLMPYPYLAKNSNYTCKQKPTTTPAPTSTPAPTKTPAVGGSSTSMPTAPGCPDPRQEAPTLLSVTKSGNDGVELVWSQPDANVEYYIISYGFEGDKEMFGVPNTGKTTSFRVGGLDLSKKYFFKVRSQKGCAVSEPSNEVSYPYSLGEVKGLANTTGSFATLALSLIGTMGGSIAALSGWKSLKKSNN